MSVNALSERSGGVIGTIGPIGGKGVWSLRERGLLAQDFYDDVSLLLHCNGANGSTTFVDSSKHGHVVTANGNAQISTAQSKFGGASAAFDGNGDYLSLVANSGLEFGTGDFTIEFWVRMNSSASLQLFFEPRTAANQVTPVMYMAAGGGVRFFVSGADRIQGAVITTNQWYHIAVSRGGGSTRMFIDGNQTGSVYADTNNYISVNTRIGIGWDNFSSLNGYIDDLRITKGRARYTPNFSPPTAAFPDDTNGDPHFNDVSLLLHMDGSNGSTTFTDSSSNAHTVTANGNAQISTAQSKFGGASAAFDGNGDWLSAPNNAAFQFGTGNFTIEFWLRLNATSGFQNLYDSRTVSSVQTGAPTLYLSTGQIFYFANGANRITGSTLSANVWNHVALCRTGTTTRLFVDGAQVGSNFTDNTNYTADSFQFGRYPVDNVSFLNGYIDDLRITKGVARYTGSFTPPQRQFRP